MAELTDYSEKQRLIIESIKDGDKGFHSEYLIADYPLYGMLATQSDGGKFTQTNSSAEVAIGSDVYSIGMRLCSEQECWFFTVTNGTDVVTGVLHFNTVYNAKGMFSIVFLNDSEEVSAEGISNALPYTNILIMRK